MNRREPMSPQVQTLADQLLNEVIAAEGIEQLERQLSADVALQQQFRDYCQLHVNLDTELRSQRVVDEVSRCILLSHAMPAGWTPEDAVLAPSHMAERRSSLPSFAALATCLLLTVSIGALAVRSARQQAANQAWDEQQADAEKLDIITVRLATAESRTLPIGDVGTVSIQGPAHFELIGTQRARLYQGRIKVRITHERGHGFVVETPRGHVTDLGTEFGVDVDDQSKTGVVVFEGEVDLTLPSEQGHGGLHVERLIQGDGLSLQHPGQFDRIMSVITGNVVTFQRRGEALLATAVIADVSDNIRSSGFRKFYEIVPGGLREDALAYADRPAHDWNGLDAQGMPSYLIGADYVKPFNNDKMRGDVEISVALARPARLFVFFDDRVPPPDWLRADFHDTGDKLGMDVGRYVLDGVEYFRADRGEGAGNSIDATFSIWEQVVRRPGVARLGPNSGASEFTAMYGIAAVPLEGRSERQ